MFSSIRVAARRQFSAPTRRFASSTTENAQAAAKEQAAKAQAIAQESAAKAQAAAAVYASKAMAILGKSGEKFAAVAAKSTGRTGKLLKAVERSIPPTIYYTKVGIELAKLTFRGQKMSPPDLATFQSTLKSLFDPKNLIGNSRQFIAFAKNATSKDVAQVGVIVAELIGFFTVGEIVGRRKLVGYKGKVAHH